MRAQDIMLAVAGFAGFTAILTFFSFRQQRSTWTGYLETKATFGDIEYGSDHFILVFRTDKGKKVEIEVGEQTYQAYLQGDHVIKRKGSAYPDIISRMYSNNPPTKY